MISNRSTTKPTLYITMGLPASGKTTFSKRFAAEQHIFFLNCDLLRLAMIDTPTFSREESTMVYETAAFIAKQHLEQGLSVICNGNYHQHQRRLIMQKIAEDRDAEYCILWINTPYKIAKERIQQRDHEIPLEKMVHPILEPLDRMHRGFEKPLPNEPAIIIDGTMPYDTQRKQIEL